MVQWSEARRSQQITLVEGKHVAENYKPLSRKPITKPGPDDMLPESGLLPSEKAQKMRSEKLNLRQVNESDRTIRTRKA